MSDGVRRAGHKAVCGLVNLVFPDECRVCSEPLHEVSRIPVCSRCLKEPEPLHAEFFCVTCRTPFLNRYPLDETGRCALCRLGLNGFDAVYSFGTYDGTLRKLIHLFKFQGVRPLQKVVRSFSGAGPAARTAIRRDRADAAALAPPLAARLQSVRPAGAGNRAALGRAGSQAGAAHASHPAAGRAYQRSAEKECARRVPGEGRGWTECASCWWTMF